MKKYLQITAVVYLSKYQLRLRFNDNKMVEVDFKPFLDASFHPAIRQYLDINLFKQYNFENGELMWGNYEMLFPIADLYQNTILPSSNQIYELQKTSN